MEPASFTGVAAAAGGAALSVVIDDLYEQSKGAVRSKISKLRTKKTIGNLYTKVSEVRKVKTIWQVDKAIDIHDFYCPTKIKFNGRDEVIEVNDADQLGSSSRTIIRGTVGQGKSIFLRYLASRELVKGQRIPVFLELRRVKPEESVLDALEREMVSLGFLVDRELTEYLLSSSRVSLFFDAFDEIDSANSDRIIDELEHLSRRYACAIYITTRPDTPVCQSAVFDVCDIMPLSEGEYKYVVRKVCGVVETAESIIAGVEKSGQSVRQVLTTPLMVALLVVRFRAEQSVPETRAAFYEGLFLLLLSRHDKSKAGFTRERRSSEGDSAFESFFDNLCFETRKFDRAPIQRADMVALARVACIRAGIESEVDNVLYDVSKITCLLLEEGGEYRFIHKSVEEFHASRRVRLLPEADAQRIYGKLRHNRRWVSWQGELSFLETVDRYRYYKYFVIPEYLEYFDVASVRDLLGSDSDRAKHIEVFARAIYVYLDASPEQGLDSLAGMLVAFGADQDSWLLCNWGIHDILDRLPLYQKSDWDELGANIIKSTGIRPGPDRQVKVSFFDASRGSSEFKKSILQTCESAFDRFVDRGLDAAAFVERFESQSGAIDL